MEDGVRTMDLSQTGVTCAVITAAGLSSRMGAFKPLLPFAGTTIAARCVENFRRAGVENIIMLTGYRGDELRAALAGTGVRFLENPDYRTTQMFDTIRIGLAALPEGCGRVLLTPVDIPAVRPETIAALLRVPGAAARPRCGGRAGHPLLLDASLVPLLLTHDGTDGLRGALRSLGVAVTELETDDAGTLLDADTPADYEALLRYEEGRA